MQHHGYAAHPDEFKKHLRDFDCYFTRASLPRVRGNYVYDMCWTTPDASAMHRDNSDNVDRILVAEREGENTRHPLCGGH